MYICKGDLNNLAYAKGVQGLAPAFKWMSASEVTETLRSKRNERSEWRERRKVLNARLSIANLNNYDATVMTLGVGSKTTARLNEKI